MGIPGEYKIYFSGIFYCYDLLLFYFYFIVTIIAPNAIERSICKLGFR